MGALKFAGTLAAWLWVGIAVALAQTAEEIDKLQQQGQQLFDAGTYAEALATLRTVATGIEKLETARDGRPGPQTANALNHVSWSALFARTPGEALKASERAHTLAPDALVVETNRAHALLFLGRSREADKIYLAHKGKRTFPNSDKTWEDSIVEDFDLFRAAGIVQKAFPRIVAALGVKHPELNAEIERTRKKVDRLYGAGEYREAIDATETLVDLTGRRFGEGRTEFATAIEWLALSKQRLGLTAEAGTLMKRALTIRERALGHEHSDVGLSLNGLAELYRAQGRYAEAEPLYKRSLLIYEKAAGPDHPWVATVLNNLALLYRNQSRSAEAEPLYKRSLLIYEKALGPDLPSVATSLNNLAALYWEQGRYAESEPLMRRALTIREKALGPDHADVGRSLNDLGELYRAQGRDAEAEPLYKRGLAITEAALGPNHPEVGTTLHNLAALYQGQGRYTEAEPLARRDLVITETALGPDHPNVGSALYNLALIHQRQGRFEEADPLFKRSVAIGEKALGPDHPNVGSVLNGLAEFYRTQGRYAEAEPLHLRALAIVEKTLGADHPSSGQSLNNLAALYDSQGRYAEAESLYTRSLSILEKALGPDDPRVAILLNNLARLHFMQRDWPRAADYWRRSTGVIARRAQRGTDDVGQALTGKRKTDAEKLSWQFWGLVKAEHRLMTENRGMDKALLREMFQTAQWALASEAAVSLGQMAARVAKDDQALSRLVRERQDLVEEWQKRDGVRITAASQAPDKRDRSAEAANVSRLFAVDARLTEIDKRLAAGFPDYVALARPLPLTVEEVQTQLGADEALVLFLDTDDRFKPAALEETFIWVITNSDMRWVKSELGTPALTREVSALRCGLDAASWEDDGAAKCTSLLKVPARKDNGLLPFDVARAHALYHTLFGELEDLIKDKQLLIVPSGPLTALPFQVLVTAAPNPSPFARGGWEYGSPAWIINRHAITVLPSVASLKSLRQSARASTASQPFIGFGNPLLAGPSGTDKRAWTKQSCPQDAADLVQVASRSVRANTSRFFGESLADVELIRHQAPLPETADELCRVARSVGAPESAVHLGDKATETIVKALSLSGALAQARVVHFATHGLLAGETGMVIASKAEPALILTPPEKPTKDDDGLLTASEVAELKLDADWVVLSACNTAAGGSDDLNAQALSGLARAFFYAGARALLVSHWAVDSNATVRLVTKAFAEIKVDGRLGRAEALRRSMQALIRTGGRNAHPTTWAPFVVVGEGAAPR